MHWYSHESSERTHAVIINLLLNLSLAKENLLLLLFMTSPLLPIKRCFRFACDLGKSTSNNHQRTTTRTEPNSKTYLATGSSTSQRGKAKLFEGY